MSWAVVFDGGPAIEVHPGRGRRPLVIPGGRLWDRGAGIVEIVRQRAETWLRYPAGYDGRTAENGHGD